ncbi:MAG TPA: family 16 glycoside hydrolase [Planctomycetota bacterium]|nr:family 16 glycoside hydrolase [Planctomycetota bacterium]
MTALALAALALALPQDLAAEATYYRVDHLVPPEGALLEVGGMDWLPDGRLALSTRHGQVWLVEDALADDPRAARFTLFAEGLQEGLGLAVVDGVIHVVQRGELSRLLDTDGDGRCDRVETVCNAWGNSGHYHEFAFGLPRDDAGNFYVSLNVSFGDPQWWHGRSVVPDRGWVVRIAPDGSMEPFALGLRSPCGLGRNAVGDLFATDNQGDWMPACPIFHLVQGAFYGHPASLNWTPAYREARRTASDTNPPERERTPAAAWIPYDWSRSAGSLVPDTTGGAFGPFADDRFVAELTNGYVLRAQLERVRGEYQGAVFPFRRQVGSAVRVLFGPDGTLFAGLTERGWGGQSPGSGVARVRWTGVTPLEVQRVHLVQDGFELTFTEPLAEDLTPEQCTLELYDYDWWWEYGSPVRNLHDAPVVRVETAADRRSARLVCEGLEAGWVARVKLSDVRTADGKPLLHDEFAYTINQLPEGPRTDKLVARLVTPPPPRESSSEGVLLLQRAAPQVLFEGAGWSDVGVKLADDPTHLARHHDFTEPEDPAAPRDRTYSNLREASAAAGDLTSRLEFGDLDTSFSFMLPRDSSARLWLMGRYGIRLTDSAGKLELTPLDLGGLEPGASGAFAGKAPDFNAFRGAGEWHWLTLRFQAPRFDAAGNKLSPARLQRLMVDDVLLQDEVELPEPSVDARLAGEAARGPLVLEGGAGEVALRNWVARDRGAPDDAGWTRIFDGETLDGWRAAGAAQWSVENGAIVGRGPAGHLFSPRGDYTDVEVAARVRINEGGNSGLYARAAFGEGWPAGYEAQVNSTHPDPQRTGGVYGLARVEAQLVPVGVWFDCRFRVRDEPSGTRLSVWVNGVQTSDVVDPERRHAAGHVALQQHHDGSQVEWRDVRVRELGPTD